MNGMTGNRGDERTGRRLVGIRAVFWGVRSRGIQQHARILSYNCLALNFVCFFFISFLLFNNLGKLVVLVRTVMARPHTTKQRLS